MPITIYYIGNNTSAKNAWAMRAPLTFNINRYIDYQGLQRYVGGNNNLMVFYINVKEKRTA